MSKNPKEAQMAMPLEQKPKFSKLSHLQVLEIAPALREAYNLPEGRYMEGWSDKRMAQKHGVSEYSIAHLRRTLFGNFAKPEPEPAKVSRSAAIDDLVQRVTAIEAKLNRLMDALGGDVE